MKNYKILILSETPPPYTSSKIAKYLEQKGIPYIIKNPYQDQISLEKINPTHFVNKISGIRYNDFDLELQKQAEDLGCIVTNQANDLATFRSKDHQYKFFKKLNIKTIETYTFNGKINEATIKRKLKYSKFVIKPIRSNGGRGLNFVDSKNDLIKLLKEQFYKKDQRYIVQPFFKYLIEYRIIFIGKNIKYVIEKRRAKNQMHNKSSCNNFTLVSKEDIPKKVLKTALKDRKKVPLQSYAADYFILKSQVYLLEVNPNFSFKSLYEDFGQNVSKEYLKGFF